MENVGVIGMLNANPINLGYNFIKANNQVRERERFREQVKASQETTGPEMFPGTYKQVEVENMADNGFSFGRFFDNVSSGIGDFVTGLTNFATPINTAARFFGSDTNLIGPSAQAITVPQPRPRENMASGTRAGNFQYGQYGGNVMPQQAFMGGLAPLIGAGRALIRNPIGQIALGTGAGMATSLLSPASGAPRVTRRMRSEVRRLLMATNGNYDLVAQFMNNSGRYPRINFTPQVLMMILVKRFRNDGSFVTKAAVRKTRSTIRKLKSMKNLLSEVSSTTTRRRRTTGTRGSSNVLIKN